MITYSPLNYYTSVVLRNIFEPARTYLMDVGLRKSSCVSCYYPLSMFHDLSCLIADVHKNKMMRPLRNRNSSSSFIRSIKQQCGIRTREKLHGVFMRGFYLHYCFYTLLPRHTPGPTPRCDITRHLTWSKKKAQHLQYH